MKSTGRRLAELIASAERIAGGDVTHRASISSAHDEIDALAFAVNVMVGELSYTASGLARAKEEAEERNAKLAATQASLLRTERLAVLGQLAGGVAHQVRNPLAAIMNASFVLKRHGARDLHPDMERSIAIIQDEIHHANAIITALLDYARIRAPARRPTSVPELLDTVIEKAAVPPTILVERQLDGDCPEIPVDPEQLREAVLNVVRNAVEAMPDGGTLGLALRREVDCVVLAITDTGPGIAPEATASIFEPLRSTKPAGVGLGLVTARTLVEAHGGTLIGVPAEAGARFEVWLPIDEERASRGPG